jgi:hypothetical protein
VIPSITLTVVWTEERRAPAVQPVVEATIGQTLSEQEVHDTAQGPFVRTEVRRVVQRHPVHADVAMPDGAAGIQAPVRALLGLQDESNGVPRVGSSGLSPRFLSSSNV